MTTVMKHNLHTSKLYYPIDTKTYERVSSGPDECLEIVSVSDENVVYSVAGECWGAGEPWCRWWPKTQTGSGSMLWWHCPNTKYNPLTRPTWCLSHELKQFRFLQSLCKTNHSDCTNLFEKISGLAWLIKMFNKHKYSDKSFPLLGMPERYSIVSHLWYEYSNVPGRSPWNYLLANRSHISYSECVASKPRLRHYFKYFIHQEQDKKWTKTIWRKMSCLISPLYIY